MARLEKELRSYLVFHQNPKNRFTHLFGIPLVVLSLLILLSFNSWGDGALRVSAARVFVIAICIHYLILDKVLGALATILFLLLVFIAEASLSWPVFWSTFVSGWALQFLGHYYEGKRPAFFSNLLQLLNGPLFVVTEIAIWMGLRKDLAVIFKSPTRQPASEDVL